MTEKPAKWENFSQGPPYPHTDQTPSTTVSLKRRAQPHLYTTNKKSLIKGGNLVGGDKSSKAKAKHDASGITEPT